MIMLTCRALRSGLRAAMMALFFAPLAMGVGYPASTDSFVNDFAQVIDATAAAQLTEQLSGLKTRTGIQAVVVTINSAQDYPTGDASAELFALNLFNDWGVGDRVKNNGAMLFVAIKDRKLRIVLGDCYGNSLDAAMKQIIDERMVPALKRGDTIEGIRNGCEALCTTLENWHPPVEAEAPPAAAAQHDPIAQSPLPAESTALPVDARPPALSQSMPMIEIRQDRYRGQQSDTPSAIGILLAIAGVTTVFGLLFSAFFRPVRCPKCNGKMELCDPSHDFEHLNDGQQVEERIGSVDYQFYECAACKHQLMQTKSRLFAGYTNCSRCGFKTVQQTQQVVTSPTYYAEGSRLVTNRCQACGYRNEYSVAIPVLQEHRSHSSGIGSSFSGHSGSSGSSHSGHFGGGHSSGGGASGGW